MVSVFLLPTCLNETSRNFVVVATATATARARACVRKDESDGDPESENETEDGPFSSQFAVSLNKVNRGVNVDLPVQRLSSFQNCKFPIRQLRLVCVCPCVVKMIRASSGK